MRQRIPIASAIVFIACVDPLTTQPVNTPVWDAKNVHGFAETIKGDPDTTLAWDLHVAGGVATWRECPSADTCTDIERQRPAGEVLAVDHVGQSAGTDGGHVDVLRLSLAPRSKYVVPMDKTRKQTP